LKTSIKKQHNQIIKKIYRIWGEYLASKLKETSVSPNFITLSRVPIIVTAVICILSENYLLHLIAAVLIIIFSMFDALDGSLATLKDERSLLGSWLDPQVDRLSFLILFISIAYYLSKSNEYLAYITMYVFSMFYFRGMISSDVRLKDKFSALKESEKFIKEKVQKETNGDLRFKSILQKIHLQICPHTHNVAFYISVGLILGILSYVILFLSIYLTLWYAWENYKVIKKTQCIDKT